MVGHIAGEGTGAVGGDRAGEQQVQILQQEGHPGEGAVGQAAADLRTGFVIVAQGHGVEGCVHALEAGDGFVQQLCRRHVLAADKVRQAERVILVILTEAAHAAFPRHVWCGAPDLLSGFRLSVSGGTLQGQAGLHHRVAP